MTLTQTLPTQNKLMLTKIVVNHRLKNHNDQRCDLFINILDIMYLGVQIIQRKNLTYCLVEFIFSQSCYAIK